MFSAMTQTTTGHDTRGTAVVPGAEAPGDAAISG